MCNHLNLGSSLFFSLCMSSQLTSRGDDLAVVELLPLLGHWQGHDSDSVLGSQGEAREGV